MKPRHRRLIWILAGLAALGLAVALVLNAFQSNLVFFFTPTQIANGEAPQGRSFRIGGLVEEGSVRREGDGTTVAFRVTDNARTVDVTYRGILPDLFKEGRGIVAQGTVQADGSFKASEVLAKHDENYMPPEAAEALKRAGHPVGAPAQFVDKASKSLAQ
ncbi:cytochrome c maturation protein CcmE [Quisquiliibacterium transsilvanicum]|uniref:Cytochrome c-type biogenesis protein CcmE n=1 Tax=Quisquiliibacterium transsilvanicum TaxID=1549638 RepID=A0A7W8HI26_9BURK|nr:cytochrome c maturation protein CcmE [Quisquiliibacterium transsilvanicum]MBB5272313.1 cytochrome c-type biogenesis protein CcmE [Quisquiliibacterium transsilvanicum]